MTKRFTDLNTDLLNRGANHNQDQKIFMSNNHISRLFADFWMLDSETTVYETNDSDLY